MGGEIACQARHVSQRAAPQDVAWALGTEGEGEVRIIRCVWAAGAEPVAISTAYVPGAAPRAAGEADADDADELASFQAMLRTPPDLRPDIPLTYARAVDLELAPPQPSVARSLRLLPGQPAITVTIRFDDPATGAPAGLTTVTLVPDQFRIVIQAGGALPRGAHSGE
jgi:DNA-binding GntR family transcriptional regulator